MTGATGPDLAVEKRAAFESPARLVEHEPLQRRMRRPAATAFGSVLVVLRVIAGIVWLVALGLQWDRVLEEELGIPLQPGSQTAAASQFGLTAVLVVGSAILAVELVLAVLIWFGSNWARITVMLFATGNIVLAAVDSFTGDVEVTVRTTFITVALDILILLALSSRNARAWARLPRAGRHTRARRR